MNTEKLSEDMDAMKIFHLIPSLHYSGAAKQLTTLALGLPGDRFQVQIGVWGETTAATYTQLLRQAGTPVHLLGKARRFDPLSLWNLHQVLRSFQPDVIHTWSAGSLRCLALAAGRWPAPVVAANILNHKSLLPTATPPRPGFVDRWLLARTACLVARGQAETERFLQAGLPEDKITLVPPVIATPALPLVGQEKPTCPMATGRFILCAGQMEPHKGFRDAIWALDILTFLFKDLSLVLVGDGPDRARLEHFTQAIRLEKHVHFLGARADVAQLLDRAAMVWVPSLADGGHYIALEALAAGKPVVASNRPGLREIIRDGETGFLIPPGNKLALARRTCQLLRDPNLSRRLGEAGRRQAAHLAVPHFLNRWADLYARLAA